MDEPRSVGEALDSGGGAATVEVGKKFQPKGSGGPQGGDSAKAAPELPVEPKDLDKLPKWREQDVKATLRAMAGATRGVANAAGSSTFMTEDEINQLAPPLTNIINRNAQLRGMANASDAVAAGLATLGIVMRNASEISDTRRERRKIEQREAEAQAGTFEPITIEQPDVLA